MTAVRCLLLTIGLFATAFQAQAQEAQNTDLTDYLTPEELVYEFGISQETLFQSMRWNMSFENPRLQILINKAEKGTAPDAQTLEAYLDGVLIHKFKVSTGKEVPATKPNGQVTGRRTGVGTFRIHTRSRNHKSGAWGHEDPVTGKWIGASMPFAQFFNQGIAIHATTPDHFSALGRRDSGGCVRLHPTNAKIMWDLVGFVGVSETIITVYDGSRSPRPYGIDGDQPVTGDQQAPAFGQQPRVEQYPSVPTQPKSKSQQELEEQEGTRRLNEQEAARLKAIKPIII